MVITTNDHITKDATTAAIRLQLLILAVVLSFELRFIAAASA